MFRHSESIYDDKSPTNALFVPQNKYDCSACGCHLLGRVDKNIWMEQFFFRGFNQICDIE